MMAQMATIIAVLIAIQFAHLVEEIKTGFRKKFPLGEMPKLLFIGLNIGVYAFCFWTLFLSVRGDGLAIPLTWIFAVAVAINGVLHIGIMAVRREYFSGGFTSFILLPVSVYLILRLMSR